MPPVTTRVSQEALPGSKRVESFWKARRRMGGIAGILWLLVFSGGILVDAEDSRVALGWKQQDVVGQAEVARAAQQLVANNSDDALLGKFLQANREKLAATELRQKKVAARWPIHNFICGMLFFTPINVAWLALLAGFIGGCATSKSDLLSIKREIAAAQKEGDSAKEALLLQRQEYLREHPFHSMVRSFIIYLIFISGLYVFSSDPFNASSQVQGFTQYMRLAGIVSLLGFVVGYDPTKLREWMALVPSPSRSSKAEGKEPPQMKITDQQQLVITSTHSETVKAEGVEASTDGRAPIGNGELPSQEGNPTGGSRLGGAPPTRKDGR